MTNPTHVRGTIKQLVWEQYELKINFKNVHTDRHILASENLGILQYLLEKVEDNGAFLCPKLGSTLVQQKRPDLWVGKVKWPSGITYDLIRQRTIVEGSAS